jgi:hypothetical protein
VAPLLTALRQTLDSLGEIGLGCLSLDRVSGTLSSGEAQGTKMIRHLGESLTDVTYVFEAGPSPPLPRGSPNDPQRPQQRDLRERESAPAWPFKRALRGVREAPQMDDYASAGVRSAPASLLHPW